MKPHSIVSPIPHTRWWMWTPPSVSRPPGHQETLRVSRALVRIARKESRNATSTTNADAGPGLHPVREGIDADDLRERRHQIARTGLIRKPRPVPSVNVPVAVSSAHGLGSRPAGLSRKRAR